MSKEWINKYKGKFDKGWDRAFSHSNSLGLQRTHRILIQADIDDISNMLMRKLGGQKYTERISGTILGKIISSFIILTKIRQLFVGIDSSGFKAIHASQYYTERVKLRRRKYIKLSLAAEVLQQIICTIKIRRAPSN